MTLGNHEFNFGSKVFLDDLTGEFPDPAGQRDR